MNAKTIKLLRRPAWLAGVAALFAVIGSLVMSGQNEVGVFAKGVAELAIIAPAIAETAAGAYKSTGARANKCVDCGVVESMREIDSPDASSGAHAQGRTILAMRGETAPDRAPTLEITIRLQDGSLRVLTDPSPANWRRGERVQIMAGAE